MGTLFAMPMLPSNETNNTCHSQKKVGLVCMEAENLSKNLLHAW